MIAILAAPALTSCSEDFLDRKPLGVATEGDLTTGGYEEKAFGLYGKARTQAGISDFTRVWVQSIRADDDEKGSSATDAATDGNCFNNFAYTAANGHIKNNWDGHYSLIYACNDLIVAIDESGDTSEGTLVNRAEACVLRAWAYFELRRDFGEVPIIDYKIVTASDAAKAKSTVAEVDAFIKTDLEYAAAHLPATWPAYPGRATKGFANTMLAKLYLYQKDYTNALTKANEVISSGNYSLMNSYATLFTPDGDNGTESIFEIQFTRTASGTNYSSNYWECQGIRGSGTWDLGWGFNVPSTGLLAAYESITIDKRYGATILKEGESDGYSLTLPTGLDQKYWNKKAYTDPATRKTMGENKNHWTNIKLIRYADVLLMAAEAANETGDTSTATTYLNQIRTRAGLANTTATTQATLRAAIKQERRIEFAMEGERFYDLVRWGDAPSVLGGLGYVTKNQYFPIPQTAIDQSNGLLKQNSNY